MLISDHDLQAVKDLRQKNLNIQAFNLAKSICPLEEWEGQGRSLKHLTLCPIWERPERVLVGWQRCGARIRKSKLFRSSCGQAYFDLKSRL